MGYISAQQTRYSHLISGFFILAILLVSAGSADAGTFITQCNDCHGMPPKDGASRKSNPHFRSYSAATVGSHLKHLTATPVPNDCVVCHGAVVSTSNHQNEGIDMASPLAGGSYGKPVFFNQTSIPLLDLTARCSNVSCHADPYSAGTIITPIWGTAAGCAACHTGSNAITATGPATGSHALTGHAVVCISCHAAGTTQTTAPSTGHADGNIDIANVGYATLNKAKGTAGVSCSTTLCHGSSSPAWGANTTSATCTKCHGVPNTTPAAYTADIKTAAPGYNGTGVDTSGTVGTITGGVSGDAQVGAHDIHLKGTGGYKTGGIVCADCHAVTAPGDAGHMNGTATMTWSNLARNVGTTPYNSDKGAIVPSYSAPNCSTNYCHGGGFAAAVQGTGLTASWVNGTYLVNPAATKNLADCNKCHQTPPTSSTKYAHPSLTIASDCSGCHGHNGSSATHMDGILQATSVSSGGSPCYGCHSVYNVMNGSAASFHHVLDDASPDQAPNAGTYPSSTTTLACTSCHTDHNYFNAGTNANLRTGIGIAGSASARDNHDFSTAAPYGICVSCHNTSLAKSTAQTVAGTTATIAIDGSASGFQLSMHNYTTTSRFGSLSFSANCVKCHSDEQAKDKQTSADKFGPHFSAQRSLLNPMGATPQAAAGADFCYRCHHKVGDTNPGGGSAKTTALKDYFGSKAMTAAAEDIFSTMQLANRHKVSDYKGLHKDDETRATISAARHVECTDCHDPHLAKSGTHTVGSATLAGVLAGVSGVGVTTWGANWAGVTAYNPSSTTVPLITATAEWQVCFKCHSGANANVATWGGSGAAAFTDLALEFNPNNASGHPVVSALPVANRLTAERLTGGWVPGSIMTCTDCHDSDSAASKGPHGSSVKWMLTGTNKAWPYTDSAGNGGGTGTLFTLATYNTGTGTTNGLFCLNCHTIRPATGVNNWHSNANVTSSRHSSSQTIAACAACHIRVPHGGKISRLLQTTNAPLRYRGNGSSGTALYTHWGAAAVNIKGSTVSSSNFACSGGQHSGTGGEVW